MSCPRGALLGFLGLLLGCATVGRPFSTTRVPDLALGADVTQIVEWFGEPHERIVSDRGGKSYETLRYRYATGTPNRARVRLLAVELVGGRVNGWQLLSDYGDDSTDFDIQKRGDIEAYRTTLDDVRTLLGQPSGIAALPTNLMDDPDDLPSGAVRLWIYSHMKTERLDGILRSTAKLLRIYSDTAGYVVYVAAFSGPM